MAQVRVPQKDGEIRTFDGVDFHKWSVSDHQVTVADDRVDEFVRAVVGAEVSKPDTTKKER